MIYSCFDQTSGSYRYFQNGDTVPVNGDLPVPGHLKARSTKLGVPSLDAGRPLPSNARYVGSGPTARGMIVRCKGSSSASFSGGDVGLDAKQWIFAAGLIGTAGLLWWSDQQISGAVIGAIGVYALVA